MINLIPDQIIEENPANLTPEIFDKPDEPPTANPKGTVKNAIIGFCIGGVLSAASIWIYSALDIVIRNKKKIEEYFEIPVIGVIPIDKIASETEASENV